MRVQCRQENMTFRANQARLNQAKPSSRQPVAANATAHIEKVQRIHSENVQALVKQTELDNNLTRWARLTMLFVAGLLLVRECAQLAMHTPSLAPRMCICDSAQLMQALDWRERSTSNTSWPWHEWSTSLVEPDRWCCGGTTGQGTS